jgi:hypothetical protein
MGGTHTDGGLDAREKHLFPEACQLCADQHCMAVLTSTFGAGYRTGAFTGADATACAAFGMCLFDCDDLACKNACLSGDAGACNADDVGQCVHDNCATECAGLGGGGDHDGGGNGGDGPHGDGPASDTGPCGTLGTQCCAATSSAPPSCIGVGLTCDVGTNKCAVRPEQHVRRLRLRRAGLLLFARGADVPPRLPLRHQQVHGELGARPARADSAYR